MQDRGACLSMQGGGAFPSCRAGEVLPRVHRMRPFNDAHHIPPPCATPSWRTELSPPLCPHTNACQAMPPVLTIAKPSTICTSPLDWL